MGRILAEKVLSSYVRAPAATVLARLGLTPNAVTVLGLLGAGAGAYLLSTERLWAGGVVVLASGLFDLFDGALARATGRTSRFGALLDSVVDRVSEAVILLGLLIFYYQRSSPEGTVLVYLAFVGSVMVSYLRARAEGLGIDCKVGVMTRPPRVVALGTGLIVGHWWLTAVTIVLAVIAGLSFLTSLQRLLYSRDVLKSEE